VPGTTPHAALAELGAKPAAAGKTNPEIAAHLVLSEKTVGRHLSNIFSKIDVTTRTAAAAFAYQHQLV
jgi:DNA-binding NarL/FixJ family response regulator